MTTLSKGILAIFLMITSGQNSVKQASSKHYRPPFKVHFTVESLAYGKRKKNDD